MKFNRNNVLDLSSEHYLGDIYFDSISYEKELGIGGH